MAKRVRFIAPVEVMQGNLSGKQELKYPSNDNKAYEAPAGVNYARNYTTRYIGAFRAKDGLKYFAVKQRSAIKISASSKLNMALLGATQSIIAVLKQDSAFMGKMGASLVAAKAQKLVEDSTTIEKYMRDKIRTALALKSELIYWSQSAAGTPICTNPFVYVEGAQAQVKIVMLSAKILREFWGVLANQPVNFTVNSALKGIAHGGNNFENVAESGFNVLGLTIVGQYVTIGSADGDGNVQALGYMSDETWTPVAPNDEVEDHPTYITQLVSVG